MPKHTVREAFHFASGGTTKRYVKGEQELPQNVLDHAIAHGFVDKPKPSVKTNADSAPASADAKGK